MNPFVKKPVELKKVLKVKKVPAFRSFTSVCKFVTKRMIKVYGLKQASDINCGRCFIWSYLVAAIWNDPLQFITTEQHVMVLNNKTQLFYDSEHLEGTKDIDDIGGMEDADFMQTRSVVDREVMTFYWSHIGYHKQLFREIIAKIDPSDLVARWGKPFYDQDETYDLDISDIVKDVDRLNSGIDIL
jgi:hypothetical protein